MKKITIYLLIALGLFTSSCSDELDLIPQDSLYPDSFYKNPQNFPTALYGIYDALQMEEMYGALVLLDGITDNALTTISEMKRFATGGSDSEESGNVDANVVGIMSDYYSTPYVLIRRANYLLTNIELGKNVLDNDAYNSIDAEARTLRALAYMRLVYLFGDVPFYTKPLSNDEINGLSRTGRDEVVAFILKELTAAADEMPGKAARGNNKRLTKQAMLGLKARCLLYEARMGKKTWGEALTATDEAINAANAAGNKLLNSYADLFTEANEGNVEYLFAVANEDIDRGPSLSLQYLGPFAGTFYMFAHQNLANAYPYADGTPFTGTGREKDAYTAKARDPRVSVNILHHGLKWGNKTLAAGKENSFYTQAANSIVPNNSGLVVNKFISRFDNSVRGSSVSSYENQGQLDIPVIRYAELILMKAEAENEANNGPNPAAYTALNAVRTRSLTNGYDPSAGLSKDAFRDLVILERRLEFPFEGLRWFDLITIRKNGRTLADITINGMKDIPLTGNKSFYRKFIPNKQELFPIPQKEIWRNPNLSQNQGY